MKDHPEQSTAKRDGPTFVTFDERPGNSGPGRYVASLVRALVEPEWSVRFLDSGNSRARIQPPSGLHDSPCAASAGRGKWLARLVPQGGRLLLGMRRNVARLAEQVRCQPATIFHAQNTGCEEMPIAARRAGVPRVVGTFHVDSTYDLEHRRSGLAHRWLEWRSNRCLDVAIAVSEATKRDWLARTRMAADRVVTIHNGIDSGRFGRKLSRQAARPQLGLALPPEAVVVGGVGRLQAAKGFRYLIEALAILAAEFPTLHLVVAGTGASATELVAHAQRLGVEKRVHWLGFQPDVGLVLDACDVFVLPSLCETLGYALLEAMAHELPAVGTSVGGIPEVIVPGETGFLVAPRDAASLAQSLRPLVKCGELRERLGRAGRERVQQHFREDDMVQKTLAVYRQLAASAAQSR